MRLSSSGDFRHTTRRMKIGFSMHMNRLAGVLFCVNDYTVAQVAKPAALSCLGSRERVCLSEAKTRHNGPSKPARASQSPTWKFPPRFIVSMLIQLRLSKLSVLHAGPACRFGRTREIASGAATANLNCGTVSMQFARTAGSCLF